MSRSRDFREVAKTRLGSLVVRDAVVCRVCNVIVDSDTDGSDVEDTVTAILLSFLNDFEIFDFHCAE